MLNLFMYESYSRIDGIPFNYISYGTATNFTVDLIDSCVATMNPALIVYAKEQGKFKHKRKHYYPFQEDVGTSCYGEYSIERESGVPKEVIIKFYKRAYDTEFINTLRSLENIYKNIISKYQEGWCVNRKGVVASNYVSSPAPNNPLSHSLLPFPKAKDMNPDAFKVVEYFIRMQKLPVNWKIPKEIKLFIEKFEALSLLES
jgi:hypothetical protein